jgi:hypothetical protein
MESPRIEEFQVDSTEDLPGPKAVGEIAVNRRLRQSKSLMSLPHTI